MTQLPHHCDRCGWEGTAPDKVRVLFHSCRPPKNYHRRTLLAWLESARTETAEDMTLRVRKGKT